MRIFNADGSEAMMCGNASRCIGKYLYEKGLTRKETIRLETLSGIKILKLHLQDNKKVVESVTVDMLKPRLENPQQFRGPSVLKADGRIFEGTYVCMGNPHFVTFVDDIDTIDIAHYAAPAVSSMRAHSESVEPVVMTSSISRILLPRTASALRTT